LLAPDLRAQEKPASPWVVDRALTVSPQSAPVPAFQSRLFPLHEDLKEGNAVPIFLRLVHEQSDATRKLWTETPREWNRLPLDKLPLEEARKFLQERHYLLRQLELGARRRTAEWNYTLDEPNPIGLLLPDLQAMRNFAPMLILQVRVALAQGDFAAAAHHLETCFAFARHIAEGPTLIHRLVAIALSMQFADVVAEFIERPDAPNLYWALTALPRPFIDLRLAEEWEYRMIEMQFPELADLDRERTPEQWDTVLRRFRSEMRAMTEGLGRTPDGQQKLAKWFPKDTAAEDPAAKSPDLAAARQLAARSKGLMAEQVAALPAAQVLLLYIMDTYRIDRDDVYRGMYLPFPQCLPVYEAAEQRLRNAPTSEGHLLGRVFFSALPHVAWSQARLERHLAALRAIEAVRLFAAGHDGRLPEKLSEVTEAPVPEDAGSGQPFAYQLEGDTGTLSSVQLAGAPAASGVRYRITIRKK
jgi:hypothetical protein